MVAPLTPPPQSLRSTSAFALSQVSQVEAPKPRSNHKIQGKQSLNHLTRPRLFRKQFRLMVKLDEETVKRIFDILQIWETDLQTVSDLLKPQP